MADLFEDEEKDEWVKGGGAKADAPGAAMRGARPERKRASTFSELMLPKSVSELMPQSPVTRARTTFDLSFFTPHKGKHAKDTLFLSPRTKSTPTIFGRPRSITSAARLGLAEYDSRPANQNDEGADMLDENHTTPQVDIVEAIKQRQIEIDVLTEDGRTRRKVLASLQLRKHLATSSMSPNHLAERKRSSISSSSPPSAERDDSGNARRSLSPTFDSPVGTPTKGTPTKGRAPTCACVACGRAAEPQPQHPARLPAVH